MTNYPLWVLVFMYLLERRVAKPTVSVVDYAPLRREVLKMLARVEEMKKIIGDHWFWFPLLWCIERYLNQYLQSLDVLERLGVFMVGRG